MKQIAINFFRVMYIVSSLVVFFTMCGAAFAANGTDSKGKPVSDEVFLIFAALIIAGGIASSLSAIILKLLGDK